jgi:hypothetical protein
VDQLTEYGAESMSPSVRLHGGPSAWLGPFGCIGMMEFSGTLLECVEHW